VQEDKVTLRPATPEDQPFLLELYASTRIEELAGLGWDDNQKQVFIKMQFLARERTYPQVDNRIVLLNGDPVGRLLVERTETEILLRDIALLTVYRNAGVGSRLIRDLMKEAATTGKPLRLHVLASSPAVRLYERLGFCRTGADDAYLEMVWIMNSYRLNPYVSLIENRLNPDFIQHAAFHRLTGDIIDTSEAIRSFLQAAKPGQRISLREADLEQLGVAGNEIKQLIEREFLIPEDYDPLTPLTDHYVARPIHNPAVAYRSKTGAWIVVRTSMEYRIYSPKRNESSSLVEEKLSSLAADIFLAADGTRTLQQIFSTLREQTRDANLLEDSEFRDALDFLTSQERQLIKFTSRREDLAHPFTLVNLAPRSLIQAKEQPLANGSRETVIDFHLQTIDDAEWEFDEIEPTLNHGFRFPHEALGGLDYGSRFCLSTLRPEVVPLLDHSPRLEVLEVGGGTGTFARSFITQAANLNGANINYHILDLSPVLMENQRRILSELLPKDRHFHQDATKFDLPGHSFDLIISNEVIADFPIASVERANGNEWQGEGAYYLEKYDLADQDTPDSFVVNAGAFRFIERAWKHLRPGGTLIVTEYGSEHLYPKRPSHLNHDEFSIHFGHLARCATKVGFLCRLLTLKEFLSLDDELFALNGRQDHIMCLNHVLKNYGVTLPYAVISKSDFEARLQGTVDEIGLTGYSFSPLRFEYHYGPNINEFLVLIMNKPQEEI
jgi:GNAT superfamily N-acetyltransferase